MKLDVVVPTFNRSGSLRKTIASLQAAPAPEGLDITIFVVDNNSTDDTREVVAALQSEAWWPIVYVHQPLQGSSQARNAGIRAGTAELIGIVDDDEEIGADWFEVIVREFADPETEFIGGPCLANAEAPMPEWLPPDYNGAIGVIQPKPRSLMTPAFPGNLNSGNAAFRRSLFERVGLYNAELGRSATGLLSDEDAELYRRILAAGLRGFHVPDFVIYHWVPAVRLTRRYHRRWCFWRGVSQGVADRTQHEAVPYLLGMPRYKVGEAVRGLLALPRNLSPTRGSSAAFNRELPLWTLLGFVYGKFFARVGKFYQAAK